MTGIGIAIGVFVFISVVVSYELEAKRLRGMIDHWYDVSVRKPPSIVYGNEEADSEQTSPRSAFECGRQSEVVACPDASKH